MKKIRYEFAIILFATTMLFQLSSSKAEDFELLGTVENDMHITLEKHLSADINGIMPLYKDANYSYLSDIQVTNFKFSSLAFDWDQKTPEGTAITMDVRFFDGITWSDWEQVVYEENQDNFTKENIDGFYGVYSIINTKPSESFQYKINLSTNDKAISPEFENVKFTYINANDEPMLKNLNVKSYEPGTKISKALFNSKGIKYETRYQWGANEDLRLYKDDNPDPLLVKLHEDFYVKYAKEMKLQKVVETTPKGDELTWPLEYSQDISKIIIHHTATTKDLNDPEKAIRDIYYYHTIAKGWGDIGYNYIIDQNGNIYEGRYGGEGVVGAHAGPGNRGSIGIAILGNYNDDKMPAKVQKSLESLIAEKTKLHGIDPLGESYFRGVKLPNIIGHNSVMATSCPGENIIKYLPIIRRNIKKLNGSFDYKNLKEGEKKDYDFEYIATLDEIKMKPDKQFQYTFRIKNTGTKTWNNKTKVNFDKNKIVAETLNVNGASMKETVVAPGQTGTFTIKINSKLKGGFNYIPLKVTFNGSDLSEDNIYIPSIVEEPFFAYEFVNVNIPKSFLKINEKIIATVKLKNTGNIQWKNFGENRISLGSTNPTDRISPFTKSTRMGYLKESTVNPGEVGTFVFNLTAPKKEGLYEEFFAPVVERITWLDRKKDMKLTINVKS